MQWTDTGSSDHKTAAACMNRYADHLPSVYRLDKCEVGQSWQIFWCHWYEAIELFLILICLISAWNFVIQSNMSFRLIYRTTKLEMVHQQRHAQLILHSIFSFLTECDVMHRKHTSSNAFSSTRILNFATLIIMIKNREYVKTAERKTTTGIKWGYIFFVICNNTVTLCGGGQTHTRRKQFFTLDISCNA